MRCLSCNHVLSDFEATRKYASSKMFVDLCTGCLLEVPNMPPVIEREDLASGVEIEQEVILVT